jgi:hypothetical protein
LYHFSSRSLGSLLGKAGFVITQALPEQAPMRQSKALNLLNHLHFFVSRLLFWISRGHLLIAAKELYICRKA